MEHYSKNEDFNFNITFSKHFFIKMTLTVCGILFSYQEKYSIYNI